MRYLREKETGNILYIDDSTEDGKKHMKDALAGGKYIEWFIYNGWDL